MLLGLNVIVGGNEAKELNRLLESVCVKGYFDQIVIVVTSKDPEVEAVAKKFTKDVYYFKWVSDFGAARNFAISKTVTEYIMWLDSDDYVNDLSRKRLLELKKYVTKKTHDIFLLKYMLDYNGTSYKTTLPRERVFNRFKSRWLYKVHEQLITQGLKIANFIGIDIEHRHTKDPQVGLHRNIKILEEEYHKDPSNSHYAFYYARDLTLLKRPEEAISIFDTLLRNQSTSRNNLFLSAFHVSLYYAYNADFTVKKETVKIAETYARIASGFVNGSFAEPLVILGDIYQHKGKLSDAVHYYKLAMTKKISGECLQQYAYYEEIPAERLAEIYINSNEYAKTELALLYIKLNERHNPNNKKLLQLRRRCIKELI